MFDISSTPFNPLSSVRVGTANDVIDAHAIADILCDPDGSGYDSKRGLWQRRARTLTTAVILHVLYSAEPEKSLGTVATYFSDPLLLAEKYRTMLTTMHDKSGSMGWTVNSRPSQVHPIVVRAIQEQIDSPHDEAIAVVSEMRSALERYRASMSDDKMMYLDFSSADITDGPAPHSVYVVISPDEMQQT
jgi:type IV secretory pathway TraG/TraD family ATPase VirD4